MQFSPRGVDQIAVVAVNDPFVMGAWAQSTGGERRSLPRRWKRNLHHSSRLDIDLSGGGLDAPFKRYSAIVEDGVVKSLNIEEQPGQAVTSAASALPAQL